MRPIALTLLLACVTPLPVAAQTVETVPSRSVFTAVVKVPDGSAAAPSRTYTLDTDLGSYRIGANNEGFSAGGTLRWDYDASRFKLAIDLQQAASAYHSFGATLGESGYGFRDNAGTMQWKNSGGAWANITAGAPGGSPGQVQVNVAGAFGGYSTFTFDGTALAIGTSEATVTTTPVAQVFNAGNTWATVRNTTDNVETTLGADGTRGSVGTATNHAFRLFTNNASKWQVGTDGHFTAVTDNTYDIGASGATRPRTGYFGTSVVAGTTTIAGETIKRSAQNQVLDLYGDLSGFGGRIVLTGPSYGFDNGSVLIFTAESGSTGFHTRSAGFYTAVVANDGTFALGASSLSKLVITIGTDNRICEFELQGSGNATAELLDGGSFCSVTKDNASTINVYYDTNGYYLQNKRGGSRTVKVAFIGTGGA